MASIQEIYESKYGSRLSIVLRSLGGDPEQIKTHWQDSIDNPSDVDRTVCNWLHIPMLDADGAAEAAHDQIIRDIEHLYFAGTPRDVAVMLSNALLRTDIGSFSIVSGESDLTYNVDMFYRTWNRHNPDADPIIFRDVEI